MDSYNRGIDIIIPVYNAYDDLLLCIKSIKKYTDLSINRVILINDKSSDERILPYLFSLEENNIILINSEKNEGFSASINKGICFSDRDVILLNSDTIVTHHWVEKIVECAYSQLEIGTVTPLSNSATLCSVPNFCEDNLIPENVTIDEFGELIEKCSFKKYPQITVAVGFCMFIKREVISSVGLFDAATFEKGYGEENDFCNRAAQLGFKHVMCDDTFIYHKGTVSFKNEEKLKLIKQHERILHQRYRKQMLRNGEYCRDNPDQIIRDNINLYLKLRNNKKNILYLIHSDFHKDADDNIGGTQLHVKDLVSGLKEIYNVFVMARDKEYFRVTAYIGKQSISFKYYAEKMNDYPVFRNSNHAKIYGNILDAFSINMVHIHHTFGLSLDMFYVAKERNIPTIITLHDYYFICPTIKLINQDNVVCIGCETREMCQKCLRANYDMAETVDFIPLWRKECEKALQLCNDIIVPSDSAKKIISGYYPNLKNRIRIVEHGSDKLVQKQLILSENIIQTEECKIHIENMPNQNSSCISGWAYIQNMDSDISDIYVEITDEKGNREIFPSVKSHRLDVAEDNKLHLYCGFTCQIYQDYFEIGNLNIRIIIENEKCYTNGEIYKYEIKEKKQRNGLNVAFIGGLNKAKGSGIAYNLIKGNQNDINWFVFGGIADPMLLELNQSNLIKTGWYSRENLSTLIDKYRIDIVCILPIWHETFCYTLSEALLCGVPVITTCMGAVGDRVKNMDCGWCFPYNTDYKDYLKLLYSIIKDKNEYEIKLRTVKNLRLKSIKSMQKDYISLYSELFVEGENYRKYDTKYIYEGYLNANRLMTCETVKIDKLSQVEKELELIKLSLTYKLATKLRNIKIPLKNQIRSIFLRIYKL